MCIFKNSIRKHKRRNLNKKILPAREPLADHVLTTGEKIRFSVLYPGDGTMWVVEKKPKDRGVMHPPSFFYSYYEKHRHLASFEIVDKELLAKLEIYIERFPHNTT